MEITVLGIDLAKNVFILSLGQAGASFFLVNGMDLPCFLLNDFVTEPFWPQKGRLKMRVIALFDGGVITLFDGNV